jgi:hypothetical protein
MGDTCGAVNSGVILLGKKYSWMPPARLYLLCSEYFRRLDRCLETPNCGEIHGGRHLASNFRRSILTGTAKKCAEVLRLSSAILAELASQVEDEDFSFIKDHDYATIERITDYFERQPFHCCQSPIREIGIRSSIEIEHVLDPSLGFCGGIGLNGTLCGAVVGGVLCLGLDAAVDLSKSGYLDTLRVVFHGLLKSDGVFRDEKRFLPAKLYGQCQQLYRTVEERYGGAHCRDILDLRIDTEEGVQQYIEGDKIKLCQAIVETVVDDVTGMWPTP